MKFDGTNNFRFWRCEVLDALNVQNLKDAFELPRETRGSRREVIEEDE